ncbi:MAG: alpha/beta hydrolase, partial [Deltaproteobacteria bacterium]|nr:alpha/beta hydrolase [Deltaproteobacteria bacterium]
ILYKMVKAIVVRNKKEALIAQLKAMNHYPPLAGPAKTITCPALVISGSQDQLVDPKEAKQLADLCRGRHEKIPDIGHSIPAETPELFNKIVLQFLTQP